MGHLVAIANSSATGDNDVLGTEGIQEFANSQTKSSQTSSNDV